jgi:hypothetical protein
MTSSLGPLIVAFPAFALALGLPLLARSVDDRPAEPRIVAVGDIHGDHDAFVDILRRAGVVDAGGRWVGGDTVLVQTGDYTDRGEQVREVFDTFMSLEKQARAAGGRVEVLLGNHEAMNLIGELRDVNPASYARFAGPDSEKRRTDAWEAYVALARAREAELVGRDAKTPVPAIYQPPPRDEWLAARPPGFIEYLDAIGPDGEYGRWLRARPATVRVGDTVFVHGGFNPETSPATLDEVNVQVRDELDRFDRVRRVLVDRQAALAFFQFRDLLDAARTITDAHRGGLVDGAASTQQDGLAVLGDLEGLGSWNLVNPDGPLWFRGFATWSEDEGRPRIDLLADRFGAARFVVGHTIPASFRITPRFSRRVFLIDTGMLSSRFKGGRASALEIRGGRVTAIYGDGPVVLTEGDERPVGKEHP